MLSKLIFNSRIEWEASFLCWSDSEDEDLVKKSKKTPKGKQKVSKKQSPPKKDPVQYVSETGGFN